MILPLVVPFPRAAHAAPEGKALIQGLDHVPVAVRDLDAAAERYRRLGFVLKPGRAHGNGIRNFHAKFPDGSEIELISAAEERDELSGEYRRLLAGGSRPAFLALYAPDQDSLARRLDAAGKTYRRGAGLLSFPPADDLRYLFFGSRNRSPTDRPGHFQHPNGARALSAVWLAADEFGRERGLLASLGVTLVEGEARVPEAVRVPKAAVGDGEILFLPGARRLLPGRRIVGATVRVEDLDAALRVLAANGIEMAAPVAGKRGRSLFIPPDLALGWWLELREG